MSVRPILLALGNGRRIWLSEGELARVPGVDLADLPRLERAEWVERWEPPGCPERLWCLSSRAAARFRLVWVERWERVTRRVWLARIGRWTVQTAWLEIPHWQAHDAPTAPQRQPKPWQPLADPAEFGWPGVVIPPPEPVRPRQAATVEHLRDPWSGQPVKLFQQHLVTIDARLDRRARAHRKA